MIQLNRLVGNVPDLASELYQEQLDHLVHGIITDKFPSLLNKPSMICKADDFIPKQYCASRIRYEILTLDPKILIFPDDEIQSLEISPKLVKISLIKKGKSRENTEKREQIFNSEAVLDRNRKRIVDAIYNLTQESYIQFDYSNLFKKLGIFTQDEAEFFLKNLDPKYNELVEIFTDHHYSNNTIFGIIPDLHFAFDFAQYVDYVDNGSIFDSDKIRSLYDSLHDRTGDD